MRKEKRRKISLPRWIAGIGSIIVILVVGLQSFSNTDSGNRTDSEDSDYPSEKELDKRYHYLLTHVTPTNIHPRLRPVHFNIGKKFEACGTLMLDADFKPYRIITANHLFSETQPGSDYYDYRVLSPKGYEQPGHVSKVNLDTFRASATPDGIQDIAICEVGEAKLISRTSKVRVFAGQPTTLALQIAKIKTIKITSISSGEQFDIVGQATSDQGATFFVMLYASMSGESGGGFLGDDGKLYVLSGGVRVTPQLRSDLNIPAKYKQVSALAGVDIEW